MQINLDWLEIQKRLSANIDGKYIKEKMNSINIHYIFINNKSEINSIKTEQEPIDISIASDRILQLVQSKKNYNNVKYKLSELLLYDVELEPNNIQSYTNNISVNFLKPISVFNAIIIPPTLFIFHQINSLFIIYHEINDVHLNKTKKVAFKIDIKPRLNHTQKMRFKLPM
jgi:ABC-type oligopeptide transport system ATPase subunit